MKVFVYGTLKKGYHNHFMLKDSKFMGTGVIDDHTLIDSPYYPYAIERKGSEVFGQVYKVTKETMKRLDMLEGYPEYYNKKKVKATIGKRKHNTYVYYISNKAHIAVLQATYKTTDVWRERKDQHNVRYSS